MTKRISLISKRLLSIIIFFSFSSISFSQITNYPHKTDFDSWTTNTAAYNCTSDGSVSLSDGWSNITGDDFDWNVYSGATASSNTGPSNGYGGSGNYLYIEASSCFSNTGRISMPDMNLSVVSDPQLLFYYHMYGANIGTLSIEVSIDNGSNWSASIWTLSGDQGNAWNLATVDLSAYTTDTDVRIRFSGSTATDFAGDIAIDQVVVEPAKPSGLSTSNINSSSATLNWTENGSATSWEIEYGINGFSIGNGTVVTGISATQYTITGLLSQTNYDWYVRSSYSSSVKSEYAGPVNFATACGSITAPYTQDFDAATPNNGNVVCETTYDLGSLCWQNSPTSDNKYWVVRSDGTASMTTGPTSDQSGSGNYVFLEASSCYNKTANMYSPELDLSSLSSAELSFFYHMYGSVMGSLNIYYSTDNGSTWSSSIWSKSGDQGNNWHPAFIDISSISPNTSVIFNFQGITGSSYSSDICIDGFSVDEALGCYYPLSQSSSNSLSNSVDLAWTAGASETQWEIEYGVSGFTPSGVANVTSLTSTSYTLGSLSSGTQYEWYVRSVCGGGSYSSWVGPNSFSTTCSTSTAATLPFTEDWESNNGVTSTEGAIYCAPSYHWDFEHSLDEGRVSWGTNAVTNNGGSGAITLDRNPSGSINVNAAILTLDLSNYTSSTILYLSFDWTDHSDENHAGDKVWIRGNSSANWVEAYSIIPESFYDNTFNLVTGIDIDNLLASATPSQTVSSTFQVKLGQEDNYPAQTDGITYDNIVILTSSCITPSNQTVSNITINSAQLAWSENGSSTEWNIEYGPHGYIRGSGTLSTVSSNPSTISGLNSGTQYDWYVRSDCGSEESEWVGPNYFTTSCGTLSPITLPYNETFEGGDGYVKNDASLFCGSTYKWDLTTTLDQGRVRFGDFAEQMNNGSGAITLDVDASGTNNTNYLDLTINMDNYTTETGLELSFSYVDHNNENNSANKILIRGSNTDSWVEIYDLNPESKTDNVYTTVTSLDIDATLANATPSQTVSSSFQLRFSQEDDHSTPDDGITFDDLSISVVTCTQPTNQSAANIGSSSADLSWTNDAGSNWDIEIGLQGFAPAGTATVSTTSNPYTYSGLDANTSYDFYVRNNCGGGTPSDWTGPYNFTTTTLVSPTIDIKTTKCSPTYSRLSEAGNATANKYFYDKFSFTVATSGLYTITTEYNYDGYVHLYSTSFDPANPLTNWITGNDDYNGIAKSQIANVNLSTGTTYILVHSAFSPNTSANYGTGTTTIEGAGAATSPATGEIYGLALSAVGDVPATNGVQTSATYQCDDKSDWTHYYNDNGSSTDYSDDKIIISVKKNSNAIGNIGDAGFSVFVNGNVGAAHIIETGTNYVTTANGWWVFNRYWKLNTDNEPSSGVNVKFYYTDNDYNAVNDSITAHSGTAPTAHTDIYFFKVNSIDATYDINPASGHTDIPVASSYNADGYWQYSNGAASTTNWEHGTFNGQHYGEFVVGHFSGGGGGMSGNNGGDPLPIELIAFYGVIQSSYNEIIWQTSSESNVDYFTIEKSNNPNDGFQVIEKIKAAGNSNTIRNYSINDNSPFDITYYQLVAHDFDGKLNTSNILTLKRKADKFNVTNIFPNPTSKDVYISYESDVVSNIIIDLINANGSIVMHKLRKSNRGSNLALFDISNLAKGIYLLKIQQGAEIIIKKIIIN